MLKKFIKNDYFFLKIALFLTFFMSGGSWITLLVNNIGKENITAAISVYTPLINVLMALNLSIFGELQELIQKSALILPTSYILIAVLSVTYLLSSRSKQNT